MRTKVKTAAPRLALARVLDALQKELLEASDEEIIEAARSLGMDPRMRFSSAFAGLKYPSRVKLEDFFQIVGHRRVQHEAARLAGPKPKPATKKTTR